MFYVDEKLNLVFNFQSNKKIYNSTHCLFKNADSCQLSEKDPNNPQFNITVLPLSTFIFFPTVIFIMIFVLISLLKTKRSSNLITIRQSSTGINNDSNLRTISEKTSELTYETMSDKIASKSSCKKSSESVGKLNSNKQLKSLVSTNSDSLDPMHLKRVNFKKIKLNYFFL